jgi:hypothetical protein
MLTSKAKFSANAATTYERCRCQPKGSPKGISPRSLRNRSGWIGWVRL